MPGSRLRLALAIMIHASNADTGADLLGSVEFGSGDRWRREGHHRLRFSNSDSPSVALPSSELYGNNRSMMESPFS